MTVRARDLEIRRPCPTRLDPQRADGGVKSWYCGHCEKSVHVLSNMTQSEARAFLAAREGQDLCVTYAVRRDGTIRFAPEPAPARDRSVVPVGALVRRRHALAAAGLGLALAACAPHDNPGVEAGLRVGDPPAHLDRPSPTIPDAPRTLRSAPSQPEEILVDGDMPARPLPLEVLKDGKVAPAMPRERDTK
jgi:hypothetical protein